MRGYLFILIFYYSEIRDLFNLRGRVYCPRGRSEDVTVFETGVVFHVTWDRLVVFSGVQRRSGC